MRNFQKALSVLTDSQRKTTIILLGLILTGTLMEMLGLGLVIPVMALLLQEDVVSRHPQIQPLLNLLGNPDQTQLIIIAMLTLVGVYLSKNIYLGFLGWRQLCFAFDIQADLSQRLFTIYLHQPYTFHLQRNSAHLISNITGEVSHFTSGSIIPVLQLITEGLVLLGIASLLLIVEPVSALIVVFVLGVAGLGFHSITRKHLMRWGKSKIHHDRLRFQHLQQGLGGAKDVKLLGRENKFLTQFSRHNLQGLQVWKNHATLQLFPRLWLEFLAVTGLAILVISMLGQGRELTSIVPTLGLFTAAAFRLIPSINKVLAALQAMRFSQSVLDNLYDEFQLEAQNPVETKTRNAPEFNKDLQLSDICYTYTGAHSTALNQLNLTIKKGESVGFIGASGSGKSTLIDVILGLLEPEHGKVLVDGIDIQQNMRNWQDNIGYVPQSIYLTDDTLWRNVAFGLSDDQIDMKAVQKAVKAAQLDEFVESLPEGLDTVVGEHGVRLSGGQRQRIGIARALYHDPEVLVLDEATSALDTETESYVMEAVQALHGSKTVLIVAHRLTTVEHCDKLYKLEKGRVVTEGTPEIMLRATQYDKEQTIS